MRRRRTLAFLLLAAAVGARAAEKVFDVRIENGRAPENMHFIRVTQGDVVRLRLSADRAMVLHLHGYDIARRVEPGRTVEMTFEAHTTGRFPVHEHAAGPQSGEEPALVYVEVYPR